MTSPGSEPLEPASAPVVPSEEEIRDLGFGSVVALESRLRLLNRDGSFNVRRTGLGFGASLHVYHTLLIVPWWLFFLLVVGSYLAVNALFACGYLLCGAGALTHPAPLAGDPAVGRFLDAFFFSVQTSSTIGYGGIAPVGLGANLLVTAESLAGLLGFALATGLLFARVSRPTAKVVFSRKALIAPYRGGRAFELRIANRRGTQIFDLQARVLFSRFELADGRVVRRFHELSLERRKVAFFPLAWTIVHPIDEASPLHGLTHEDLVRSDAEFLILLTGIEEAFSQTVHARSSYKPDEIVWGARFSNIFEKSRRGGPLTIDVGRIHAYEEPDAAGGDTL